MSHRITLCVTLHYTTNVSGILPVMQAKVISTCLLHKETYSLFSLQTRWCKDSCFNRWPSARRPFDSSWPGN